MLSYKDNCPYVEGVALESINKIQGTPYYVYSQSKITESFNDLKNTLGTNIYFSVKSNSNQAILKILNNLGVGADVVSLGELKQSLKAKILLTSTVINNNKYVLLR